MKALDFLKGKGLIKEGNSQFIIKFANGPSFELVGLMEEFKERILNPKSAAQYKDGDRVYLKNDSSGKRYKIVDFNPDTDKYLLYNPISEYLSIQSSLIKGLADEEA